MKKVTVPFFVSHQGCAHTCVFCDQRTITGFFGDIPSTEEILSKIATWQSTAGGRPLEVAFFGGSFTAMSVEVQDHLLKPLQPLLASGDILSIRVSTRPDYIDDETVKRLGDMGVTTIELGVQSMDDEVLENSVRGHNAAASEAAIRCIKAGGLSVVAQLMPGLPGDTPAKSFRSLKRVIAAGADFIRLYPVLVLRGTELARRFEAGEFIPMGLDEGVQLCKVLLHEAMLAGIPVIRIGLQADEGLNKTTVLGGCWHPALGRLTRSELYFDLLCKMMSPIPSGLPCTILCHPSRISEVTGQGRINLKRLGDRMASAQVKAGEGLAKEELSLDCATHCNKGNIITDLQYTIDEE
jgi:histone acetyltransferase (RNA polymerase elongator complex component)